jgi:cation transport regulator
MPYQEMSDLPKGVRHNLPHHALKIYLKAHNNAWEQYSAENDSQREEISHRVAWAAVKKVYEQDGRGNWHRK